MIDAFLTKRDEGLADDGHFEGDLMYDYPYGEYTCGAYNIFLMDKGFSNAGYMITDLDGDGIYEMIFAELGSSSVYDVFTLVDGEPKMILASWERCSLYYCGDYFYSSGSNGAASQVDNTYVIDGDAKEAERAFTELSDRTGELEYYYMDYSRINSDADRVSQEDYNAHIESWKSGMCEVPGLISFQEYVEKKSAENNRNQTEDYADKVKCISERGDVWYLPFDFHSSDQYDKSNGVYAYENENLDMTIRIWEPGSAPLSSYAAGALFLDDMYEKTKVGTVTYSDIDSMYGGYCVNSGYLESGRVYYDKYMVVGEGGDQVIEVYMEYGTEYKEECDQIVTEFMDDCEWEMY